MTSPPPHNSDSTSQSQAETPPATQKSVWRSRVLKLMIVSAVTWCAAEGGLRYLLFSSGSPMGDSLRESWRFATGDQNAYWALKAKFLGSRLKDVPDGADAQMGWVSESIGRGTYTHTDAKSLGSRRPVLLYGDSFAHCTTDAQDCFQGLFESPPAGEPLHLLNYGVGAYGFDQTYLLLKASIDHYDDPIVIVSCLIDDDLERGLLDVRSWPKPRLQLLDGKLESAGPFSPGLRAYLDEHGTGIRSYVWRAITHSSLLPESIKRVVTGRAERQRKTRELTRAILAQIQHELDSRDLDWFFLVFHGSVSLVPEARWEWRESFLLEELRTAEIPFVSSKRALLEDALRTGRSVSEYFDGGHYGPAGNRAVLDAINRGLAGEFDDYSGFAAPNGVQF